jgi:hypothetical protein
MAVRFLNGLTSSNSTDRPDIVSNIPFVRKHDNSGDYLSSINNLESFILSKIDGGYGGGNKPSGSHNGLGIISLQTHTGNYFTQLALDTNQNALWIRSANGATSFGSWEQLASRNWVSSQGYITSISAHTHSAADITSGTLDGARLPWNDNDGFSGTYPIVWTATDGLYRSSWLQVRGSDDMLLTRNITADGNIYAAGGDSTQWNTAVGWGNHAGLYDATGSADAVGQQVNERIDTEVFDAINSKQDAGTYADGTTYQTYGTGNNGWLMPDYNNNTSNFMRMYYDDGSREFRMYSYHGSAGEAKIALYDGGVFNTLSSTNIAEFKTAYGWGNHASAGYLTSLPSHNHDTLYDTLGSAAAVNDRIDSEVLPQVTDNATGVGNNRDEITALGSAALLKAGGTMTGGLVASGGISGLTLSNGISGSNFNITGVNELVINDPGEGIRFTSGSSGDITLSIVDDSSDNRLNLSGTGASFSINNATVATQSWVTSQGYLTSIPSTYATDAEVSTAVGAVNERIDTEVFDAINGVAGSIPTNNNQLTNGAGYITSADGGNAQTLDGINSTSFLRSDANDTATGLLVFNGGIQVLSGTGGGQFRLKRNSGSNTGDDVFDMHMDDGNIYFDIDNDNDGDSSGFAFRYKTAGSYSNLLNFSSSSITYKGNSLATTSYVDTAVSNLVASAPGALNTLNELAAALGDDANFSTTVANNIGAVNERIDTEVFDAINAVNDNIPTNNNQLTNGAGYITSSSLPSANQLVKIYNNVDYVVSGDINQRGNYGPGLTVYEGYSGGANRPFTYDTTAQFMSTSSQGFEISVDWVSNSSTPMKVRHLRDCCQGWSPWINVWTEHNFTGTNISNWNTAYGWGNHAGLYDSAGSAATAEGNAIAHTDARIEAEIIPALATIPTNNNQLTNGAGYITSYTETSTLDAVADRGRVTNQQLVSTNTSGFRVDSGSWARIEIDSNNNWSYVRLMDNGTICWDIATFDNGALEWRPSGGDANKMTLSKTGNLVVGGDVTAQGHSVYATGGTSNGKNIRMYVNDSWAYLTTNVGKYYLNAEVRVDTGKIGSYNEDLQLATSGTTKVVIANGDGHMFPLNDRTQWLGLDSNRWQVVFCEILDSAGQHEKNLQNPEGEKSIGEYETGTVLVWKGGKNVPCTEYADHMRMGIAVKGIDSPLIQGAEPVLVTGLVNEGDYIVTSRKEGHAEAMSPEVMRQQNLFDCVIGKALESGDGESYLIKTWINI